MSSTAACAVKPHPKYSWDGRTVTSTDGVGDQLPYAGAVARWYQYHDKQEGTDPTKIPKSIRGMCLICNLYICAEDYVSTTEQGTLARDDAT